MKKGPMACGGRNGSLGMPGTKPGGVVQRSPIDSDMVLTIGLIR